MKQKQPSTFKNQMHFITIFYIYKKKHSKMLNNIPFHKINISMHLSMVAVLYDTKLCCSYCSQIEFLLLSQVCRRRAECVRDTFENKTHYTTCAVIKQTKRNERAYGFWLWPIACSACLLLKSSTLTITFTNNDLVTFIISEIVAINKHFWRLSLWRSVSQNIF